MATRPFETRYFGNTNYRNPRLAISHGFPKREDGSIEGAMKAAGKGFVAKVQCIDRTSGQVLWTVVRGSKVPGRNVYSVQAHKGDWRSH